jgi:hypothetical protein
MPALKGERGIVVTLLIIYNAKNILLNYEGTAIFIIYADNMRCFNLVCNPIDS